MGLLFDLRVFSCQCIFAAIVMRIPDSNATALIFASRNIVVTGAKTEDNLRLAS